MHRLTQLLEAFVDLLSVDRHRFFKLGSHLAHLFIDLILTACATLLGLASVVVLRLFDLNESLE